MLQRLRNEKKSLDPERKTLLDVIGFIWKPHDEAWNQRFAELKEFVAKHKHCNVPRAYPGGLGKHKHCNVPRAYPGGLSDWIRNQRYQVKSLKPERKEKLGSIGVNESKRSCH
jgi:hypothetical protein